MSSFGEQLRRERELREISLREVSEATKISLRYLQALERNDFEHLPGGLFNKGFVRAYCEFIGVDAESMVNAYLYEAQSQISQPGAPDNGLLRRGAGVGPGGTSPTYPTTDSGTQTEATRRLRRRRMRWILLAGIATLVVLGLVALWVRMAGDGAPGGAEPNPSPRIIRPGDDRE
jgi:cytoskeletal protein RodZ